MLEELDCSFSCINNCIVRLKRTGQKIEDAAWQKAGESVLKPILINKCLDTARKSAVVHTTP